MKLKEFAIINMGQSPKGETYNTVERGMPFLQGRKTFGRIYPNIDTWTTNPIKIANKSEILMSVRAPVGDMNFANQEICIGRGLCSINAKNGRNKYLYYMLLNSMNDIKQKSTGTVFDSVNRNDLENLEFNFHSEKEQDKIENILGNIDIKIELNNEINNNLYELCRKIFEQTFNYDMSFESLDNLCSEITRGYTKNYVEKSNLINLNQKVNKGQNLEKQHYKYLDENQDIPKNRYVRKNDILLNSLGQGTLGRVHLFEENVNNIVIDQHISILRAGARISPYYLYYLLSSNEYQNKIENSVTGTTGMLMLNISVVRSFKIPVPNKEDIDYFDSIAKVCMDKITINTLENEKLIELRDTLLPKLMNGEINLDNVEI